VVAKEACDATLVEVDGRQEVKTWAQLKVAMQTI